ncbi:hypothetical protein PO909_001192 [Leuciscus waleckii]
MISAAHWVQQNLNNFMPTAQSFRKQTHPKNTLTPEAPDSVRRVSYSPQPPADSDTYNTLRTRSASFNPISDKDRMESFQGEQDQLLRLISQTQRGRMDEQCCSINPLSPSPRLMENSQSDQDVENFFKLISNTQNRRFDDQRVTLKPLPGKQAPPGMTAQESDQLFNMVSRIQTHGVNNQPCTFPEVFLTIGQPGETIVLPLSPRPGRPISLNVNPPKNHRSRSPSPRRSPAKQTRSRPSTPHPGDTASPISPHEDYFSLIQRVHSAQLLQNNGPNRAEPSKEAKKEKGKSSGKKEKKEGNKEKRK